LSPCRGLPASGSPTKRLGVPFDRLRAGKPLHLDAGQSALLSLAAQTAPEVESLTNPQINARLAWQPRLLDFTDAPLEEILAEFNRRNVVRLVVADPALATVRLSAAFRSDNVEGFVRLMESDFNMRAQWRGDREIALSRAK
jgi:transmembrane sensor